MLTRSISQLDTRIQILLVEDNDINRLLMCDYLNYCGYSVVGLPDGVDLFPTLERVHPHVILLDLKLGEEDGYELLQRLKSHPSFLSIPVMVVSGFSFEANKERALQLGACRYFVKPVSLTLLKEAIQEEVERSLRC
jgi:CheY-like chemotaxis protein